MKESRAREMERVTILSRCFIGSNEPHRVIPQHGCMSAVPLPFHPVSLFRSGERSIPFKAPNSTFEHVFVASQGQLVLAALLANEALLGGLSDGELGGALGALRALHEFLTQLAITQRAAPLQNLTHMLEFHLAAGIALCL